MTTTHTQALLARIDAASPASTSPEEIRNIRCAAERMSRTDLLPRWMTPPPTPTPERTQAHAAPESEPYDPAPVLEAKARNAGVAASLLRAVYCREMTSPAPVPPRMSRQDAAHARVNTFIRLVQGDPTARSDDADLLALLNY